MSIRTFRLLLVLANAAYVLWFLAPLLDRSQSDPVLLALRSQSGFGALLSSGASASVAWAILATRLLGSWFLWSIKPVGVWLFSASLFATLASAPFLGMSIQTPTEVFVGYLGTLLDGAVLITAVLLRRGRSA